MGDATPSEAANREIGVPGENTMGDATPSGNANLPIGGLGQHQPPRRGADEENGEGCHGLGRDEGSRFCEGKESGHAIQEIGVPGGEGWHGRGYLPHFDRSGVTQHVTFHLADGLAKATLERMEEELRKLPASRQDVERRKRIEEWIDAGHGSCVLREPAIAAMVQNGLHLFHGERYRLVAWVIMPNHVHVLFQPINGWTVAKIVATWKKFTARRISRHRQTLRNANLPIGESNDLAKGKTGTTERKQEDANPEIGVPESSERVWHREYWDRYMRDEEHFRQAVAYIHNNPVKAGLVARAEDWPWSSAHPGNANLPIGVRETDNESNAQAANPEIGVPESGVSGAPGESP